MTGEGSRPDPDKAAAHDFLVELRTRIAIQPLPYRAGEESSALQSLADLFKHAREAMKKYPGCRAFSDKVTLVLNKDVRPVTAKWHRAQEAGQLLSRDGADEFRADLQRLQPKLRVFASELHQMAYETAHEEVLTERELNQGVLQYLKQDLAFFKDPACRPEEALEGDTRGIPASISAIEEEEIKARRTKVGKPPPAGDLLNVVGVALSGGGIRSATFSLGAMQVLAERKLFKDVDILSTVSGGGYTGSFITSIMADGPPADTSIDQLHEKIANPYGPDPAPVRQLRQGAKYLMVNGLAKQWQMVVGALAGLLVNWTAPLAVIAALALLALLADFLPAVSWACLFYVAVIASFVGVLLFAASLRIERIAVFAGWTLALSIAALAVLAAAWVVDYGRTTLGTLHAAPLLGGSAIIAAAGPILVRFLPILRKPAVRAFILKALLILAGIVLPLLAIVLFYVLRDFGRHSPFWLAGIFAVSALVAWCLLDINRTSPQWLYRGFLSKAFVEFDRKGLRELWTLGCKHGAPYHLLNAAVNVPSNVQPTIRDRRTDFFLFSPKFCGAPSVGYWPSSKWKVGKDKIDLSTAMAVSGAAFSSHMGLASMPTLTAMLTFLNVRLGLWLRRPTGSGDGRPGFLCLLKEMTGLGMSGKEDWINVSDGGHIENMGLYELLRRRCKFIVCVDGEADPGLTFHGLMTLVRHVQIDFGIRIDPKLDDLRLAEATRICKSHFVFCRVHYPEGTGLLLYVKLSLSGNESELIKRYRLVHPEFPHQSTLDQFFDEEQFEAYRQLGVHAMDGLFSPVFVGEEKVPSIPDWFDRLAVNLLDVLPEERQYIRP